MNFLDPTNIGHVPRSSRVFEDVKLWVEEAIFGHRLWARQNPWLLFLEFLNVAEAHYREGRLFAPTEPQNPTPYSLRWRMGLRSVLFDNSQLARLAEERLDDESLWREWLGIMDRSAAPPAEGYAYLRQRFPRFQDFVELVNLVRQTTLETTNNLRWSSRFIFPFGVNAIYSDAIVSQRTARRDYNNFGRTGELLYLMISRAEGAETLKPHFRQLFDPDLPKNRLIGLLCADSDHRAPLDMPGNSFLPYRRHPTFDRLVEDWTAVFQLGLPGQDAYAHLAPLGTLHMLLFALETAAAVLGRGRPSLICEIIAPRRELVRQRSIASYYENDALSRQAAEVYAEQVLKEGDWIKVEDDTLPENERLETAGGLLKRDFSFAPRELHVSTVDELMQQFYQALEAKHDDNWSAVHSAYGRTIGLVSRRGTNRNRYAPTDDLLKTLVMARVPKRTEFGKFLADLYVHYGLVFGPTEAEDALADSSFDASSFERNRERLEARLSSMGLLKRLSDGCAYVLNPFAGKTA
ncbi:hypothetical protein [Telmatospirillum siberiense]|uniref:Uncharacterized protein n=1 Tax=Telmatospirillum siberiense TaxID=382514 RepID=A0A2N3PRA7_9PROT|nr:hypothetical protein [Telmatospirillum siberiense]PKU22912.1 hypothetical protein CWS72_18825 [Telmatospirillum siberiense]